MAGMQWTFRYILPGDAMSLRLVFVGLIGFSLSACGSDATDVGGNTDTGASARPDTSGREDVDLPDLGEPSTIEDVADEVSAPEDVVEPGELDDEVDVTEPEVTEPDVVPAPFTVSIEEPAPGATSREGAALVFVGRVELGDAAEGVPSVQWISDVDGLLNADPLDGSGGSSFEIDTLSSGRHIVTFESTLGDTTESASVQIGICGAPDAFEFDSDLDPTQWTVTGDAYRDELGWLEMTGNVQGRRGAIVNVGRPISEGDILIEFDIATGHCSAPGDCSDNSQGADGFAVSIFETATPEDTVALIESAEGGGGLGYGVSGVYGDAVVNAFHIEFDTWYNQLNDAERHTDPTTQNHMAITLNGDPSNHFLWKELTDLEDNNWHSVSISVVGPRVSVQYDGVLIVDDVVDGLSFKGGYLAFTGVTGFYYNYHRFDNLVISEVCIVE
jgi:hypothetical protein